MTHLIVMFAKAPVPGRVKTRLHARYSPEASAQLHSAFLLDQAARLLAPRPGWVGQVSVAGDRTHPVIEEIRGMGVTIVDQPGDSLGDRMATAIENGLSDGYASVTLVGSDSPTLPLEHVSNAVEGVRGAAVVLGPSTDGGFVSITARSPVPCLREEIGWSTPTTLVETLDALAGQGALAALGPFWYDVDEPGDVEFLRRHLETMGEYAQSVAPRTLAWLRSHTSP